MNKITRLIDKLYGINQGVRDIMDPDTKDLRHLSFSDTTLTLQFSNFNNLPYLYGQRPNDDHDHRPGLAFSWEPSFTDTKGWYDRDLGLNLLEWFHSRHFPDWDLTKDNRLQAWAPAPIDWKAISEAVDNTQKKMCDLMQFAHDVYYVFNARDQVTPRI